MNYDEIAAKYGGVNAQKAGPGVDNLSALAAKYGGAPAEEEKQKRGIIGTASDILGSMQRPLVDVAAIPVQLLAKAIGVEDPFQKGVPVGLPGTPSLQTPATIDTPKDWLRKAGSAAEVATYAAPAVNSVRGLAALGALGSAAHGVSETGEFDNVFRDALWGSLTGAGLGIAFKGIGSLAGASKAATGVDGQTKAALGEVGSGTLAKFINTTKQHTAGTTRTTPLGLASEALEKKIDIFVNKVRPEVGELVGETKKALRQQPLVLKDAQGGVIAQGKQAGADLFTRINEVVGEMTGHQFGQIAKSGFEGGTAPVITRVPGMNIRMNEAGLKKLQELQSELDGIANYRPTVGQVSDAITNIWELIGTAKKSTEIGTDSPLIAALKRSAGILNEALEQSAPEVARAKRAYSFLKDLEDDIGTQAGKNLQRAELILKRVVSGDKSAGIDKFLQELDNTIAPYLSKNDIAKNPLLGESSWNLGQLADWAGKMFGGEKTKTLMGQRITSATGLTENPSIMGAIISGAKKFISLDPEKYAMSLTKGNEMSVNPIVRIVDKVIKSGQGKPVFDSFVKGLKKLGIEGQSDIDDMARVLMRTYLFQLGTQPAQPVAPAQRLPQPILPPEVSAAPVPQQSHKSLSIAGPTQQALNNVTAPTSGQQFSSQARQLGDFGMNMQSGTRGLRVT